MSRLVLFGLGYCGARIVAAFELRGWAVVAFGRDADPAGVRPALDWASHVVSTAPPGPEGDALLAAYGDHIAAVGWIGYLSSTGVYGDTGGTWVDETAPLAGRRSGRIAADAAWLALGARVLRLPGIYGPGRSALDRVAAGKAHRLDLPGQIFSRIHVDDVVGGVLAALDGLPGAYNLADDRPASQNTVVEQACALLGIAPPPIVPLDRAGLSPAARAFYAENRRVSAGKAGRLLGWRPAYSDYRAGLRALIASTRPITTSTPPAAASIDQR